MSSFFRFIWLVMSSLFLIFISLILAFVIGAEMLEPPCDDGIYCSSGANDVGIGMFVMFFVIFPSAIWLCLGELYVFMRKRNWHSRLLMLIFPSIYTVLVIYMFL